MDTKNLKELSERYTHEVWCKKDISALDRYISPSCIIHSPLGLYIGPEAMRKIVEVWTSAFPDLVVKNEAVFADSDCTIVRFSAKGKHLGTFKGHAATNRSIAYSGVTIYRFYENKIVEYFAFIDIDHILSQIKPLCMNA
jgi:predicted ester cyclase